MSKENTIKTKLNRFIVTAVDYGDNCDGKARVLGAFDKLTNAEIYVHNDIEEWVDNYAGLDVVCDFEDKCASCGENRCEWNIEEKEIEIEIELK